MGDSATSFILPSLYKMFFNKSPTMSGGSKNTRLIFCSFKSMIFLLERCQSGLLCSFAKAVGSNIPREFESPPLRAYKISRLYGGIFYMRGICWTKFECISSRIPRTNARLVRSLRSRYKTKNFPSFLRFSAGGVGGADKKRKGNFWF